MSAPAAGLQHHSQAVRKLGRRFRRGARKRPRGRQVRVVEFDEGTPFVEQLRAMAATGVLVSVHTSNLANAQFLLPGRAVIELIQRNWVWHNLDRSFQARACCPLPVRSALAHAPLLPGARARSALPVTSALAYATPESGGGCSATGRPSANSVRPLPATGAPHDHLARLGHRQQCWMPCARPMASGAPGAVPPGPWSVLLWAHGRPRPMSHPMRARAGADGHDGRPAPLRLARAAPQPDRVPGQARRAALRRLAIRGLRRALPRRVRLGAPACATRAVVE